MFSLATDPIREALQARADHLSRLVGWANITVAVGVALEGVEIIHDIVTWGKKKRRRRRERIELREIAEIFPAGELRQLKEVHADEPRWVKRLLRVGLIIVVIGVVAEWRSGAKLEDAHNAIHQHDLEKIAAADEKAGDAATSAKTADDLGTDLLNKYKAAERELDELRARTAPRRLSSEQKQLLAKGVSAFTSKRFVLTCIEEYGDEIKDFAHDFFEAFSSPVSGLTVQPPICALEWVDTRPCPPIQMWAGVGRQHDSDVLLNALIEIGINKQNIVRTPNTDRDNLVLIIGPKPK